MPHEEQVPIWFFIGGILHVYGVLIMGAGLYEIIVPPPLDVRVALYELHADIWWGAIMIVFGSFYCIRFWPGRGRGESTPPIETSTPAQP